jgi:hypothetical protein
LEEPVVARAYSITTISIARTACTHSGVFRGDVSIELLETMVSFPVYPNRSA